MWTDPHISKALLDIHLSQETDLASRKIPAVEAALDWIMAKAGDRALSILDLGCGPGLYAERLAAMGHQVTGMDFSAAAIAHARVSAAQKGLAIDYLTADYADLDHENQYDLIMMIFTDFGALPPHAQDNLLARVRRALKPGGRFIFDVLNSDYCQDIARTWDACARGFWRPHPYLVLSDTFCYDNARVFLSQHLVADHLGTEIYRFYAQTFSRDLLQSRLAEGGFGDILIEDGILPDSDLYRSQEVTFCSAAR